MARERISDDYEDFEPDVTIWPFVLLAFLLQLLPLTLSVLLKGGLTFGLFWRAVGGVLPLLFAASIMRNGERPWKLPVASVVYGAVELLLWIAASRSSSGGYALGIPFALALAPSVLGLLAYVFFLKRIHGHWIGTLLVSYLLLLVLLLSLWRYADNCGLWMIYPLGLVALATAVLPVTRRSDSTPWFVVIPMVFLIVTSSLFSEEFAKLFLEEHTGRMVAEALLSVLAFDQPFWYTLSFLFVFSGLASKSSYRRFYEDDSLSDASVHSGTYDDSFIPSPMEEPDSFVSRPEPYTIRDDSRYTFPSGESRYGRQDEEEMPRREEPARAEEPQPRPVENRSREQVEETMRREREDFRKKQSSSSSNDKWYEFISGGINVGDDDKAPSREPSRSSRPTYDNRYDRRDYDDRRDYRREDRYRESERDAYRRNLYDDREDRSRYYEDDRRDYDDRRDERRDRRYDDRYYDRRDDRGYDDRDRRDYPRPSRRYEDNYRDDRGRYDRD